VKIREAEDISAGGDVQQGETCCPWSSLPGVIVVNEECVVYRGLFVKGYEVCAMSPGFCAIVHSNFGRSVVDDYNSLVHIGHRV
ncbi:hypothetical protein KR084_009585, partial [Drosophila pseudotakahashii]